MILYFFQIINAPKKNQEDNLSEDEKAEKSVSFVFVCFFVCFFVFFFVLFCFSCSIQDNDIW